MNNKYNIGDKVMWDSKVCKVTDVSYRDISNTINQGTYREYVYDLCIENKDILIKGILKKDLTPYIEEDTQESETRTIKQNPDGVRECIATNCPNYDPEYNKCFMLECNHKEILAQWIPEPIHRYEEVDDRLEHIKNPTVGLDYEKEYNLLLEEYETLNEELYIAKTAIKMLSELI